MEKILISSCFLGNKVRYDGGDNLLINTTLKRWQQAQRLVVICPELAGGLSVPRAPAEIKIVDEKIIVSTNVGEEVTDAFERGAKQALLLCHEHDIHYALLKESSPSCGSSTIYNGEFKHVKISGQGVTTALLRAHGIKVFSEQNLMALISELS